MSGGRPVVVVGDVGLDVLVRPRSAVTHGGDTPSDIALHPGGAGGNTAAWLTVHEVGVALVARVGDDPAGVAARAELTSAGVRCLFAVDQHLPTCLVVVIVDASGERTMLPDRGANSALAPSDIDLDAAAAAAGSGGAGVGGADRRGANGRPHLHLSGFVLLDERSRAAGLAALAGARSRGWSTSVDPQAANLVQRVGASTFLTWVGGVDLLLPNEAEARALGGIDAMLAAAGQVVVTHGPGGARWLDASGEHHVPAPTVHSTDTTGCGDAFNAGLLASWLDGSEPAAALAAGVRSGSAAAAGLGARPQL